MEATINKMSIVFNAIDWLSVKFNLALLPVLFIDVSGWMKVGAAVATFTTILYNSIRIYKEIKKK